MWTYLAKFLAYNTIGLKNYTKTSMTRNWFQSILLIMLLWKTLFSIQVLVWELLYYISFLLFMETFFSDGKETFLISVTFLAL